MKGPLVWIALGAAALILVAAVSTGVTLITVRQWVPAPGPVAAVALPAGPAGEANGAGKLVALPKFTTNLSEPGSAIEVTLVLVVRTDKDAERVEKARLALQDSILRVLRSLRVADVNGPGGQEKLAQAVLPRVNEVLGQGTVQKVLIPSLVHQP